METTTIPPSAFVYLFATATTSEHRCHIGSVLQKKLGVHILSVLTPHSKTIVIQLVYLYRREVVSN